ncbi:MAG: tryptophan--tRNA ligase [Candidatus Omnitrophica bacterium]|nr:tryptophan--tRNA ligase [Candidatus Omnitrophota bacterium]
MRPTGKLHLGHLVGALNNWSKLQNEYNCFFMVADWHALMSEYENPASLREYSIDNVIDWISCGIDPQKATLFIQSQVPEHLELFMIFSCISPLGWLERCPTYKEQLRELTTRHINTYAFLGYPVLQAADILLYKAEVVPVGEDQLPHLELTREISSRFNYLMKEDVFPQPQAQLTEFPRLLGLDARKMSKSYDNYISLSDVPELVNKKVMGMFTDPQRIKKTDPGHPEVCNLYNYYKIFSSEEFCLTIETDCRKAVIGCTDCKKKLAGILNKCLAPIQEKRAQLIADKQKIMDILETGSKKARSAAMATMQRVRKTIGI